MHTEILQITRAIFNEYHQGFIYVDLNQVDFHQNEIRGKFQFTGSAYLKTYSKIFNNTEAMFIFNQLQYLLLAAIFYQQGAIQTTNLNAAYRKLDGIVYKDMQFNFKKMITENSELSFICRAAPYSDRKQRECFEVQLDLANSAFEIVGTAVCLNSSVHCDGVHG